VHLAETRGDYEGADHFHFADASAGGFGPSAFAAQVAVERHLGGANYLFTDAHVDALSWTRVQRLLTPPGNRFIRPDVVSTNQ